MKNLSCLSVLFRGSFLICHQTNDPRSNTNGHEKRKSDCGWTNIRSIPDAQGKSAISVMDEIKGVGSLRAAYLYNVTFFQLLGWR